MKRHRLFSEAYMQSFLFLGMALLLLAVAQVALADAPVSFAKATQDYRAGKYQTSLIELEKYRVKYPNNLQVHYYEALCFQGLNQLDRAREEFELVAREDSGDLKSKAEAGLKGLLHAKTEPDNYSNAEGSGPPKSNPSRPPREGHLYSAIEYVDVNMCPACKAFAEAFWQAEFKLKWLRTFKIHIETGDASIALYKVGNQHPYVVLLDGVGKVLFKGKLPPDPKIIYDTCRKYE
jgi:tetratricopeptide (TPR) repeat protein